MPRRLVVRLAAALVGLVVALAGGLIVLVLATSAPALPPPPLPTATAQPGPQSTPLGGAPAPVLAEPGVRSGAGADPNGAIRILAGADLASAVAATDAHYEDEGHPRAANPPCGPDGRWTVQVDPENVVGYPYSRPPSAADWARAADVVGTVSSICPAPIMLSWFAHDKARPRSDRWTASLLPADISGIDGPALRRYALGQARQL